MPTGPDPKEDWSRGFFELASAERSLRRSRWSAPTPNSRRTRWSAREHAERPASRSSTTRRIRRARWTSRRSSGRSRRPTPTSSSSRPTRPTRRAWCGRRTRSGSSPSCSAAAWWACSSPSLLTSLGPMLNGIVNYDFWVPEPTLDFPGIEEFLAKYQERGGRARASIRSATTCRRGPTPTCRSWARRSRPKEPRPEGARRLHPRHRVRDRGRQGQVRPERRVGQDAVADGPVPEHQEQRRSSSSGSPASRSSSSGGASGSGELIFPTPKPGEVARAPGRPREAAFSDGPVPERHRLGRAARRLLCRRQLSALAILRPARHRQHRPSAFVIAGLLRRLRGQQRVRARSDPDRPGLSRRCSSWSASPSTGSTT